LAATGSYARGDQPRSVPDSIARPYAKMVADQREYNDRQAGGPGLSSTGSTSARPYLGQMYQGSVADIAELRKQQAEFKQTERAAGRENAWLALPALAPVAAVMGLEGAAYIAGRLAPAVASRLPLVLERADPYLRVGDNWATRAGRQAHAALRERVALKPGWKSEPTLKLGDGRVLRPDVRTPPRVRAPGREPEPYQMELKPNTASGRAAAARAVKKYEATGVKTRPIFYDPNTFL